MCYCGGNDGGWNYGGRKDGGYVGGNDADCNYYDGDFNFWIKWLLNGNAGDKYSGYGNNNNNNNSLCHWLVIIWYLAFDGETFPNVFCCHL